MYDVNFFSVLKRQKQKNKNVRIIFIGFLVFLLAINAALLTFGYLAKTKLENHIKQNQQYIDSPSTKAKVRDAAILDKELGIAESYLATIKLAAEGIEKTSLIKLEIVDHIRSLTPVTTKYESVIFMENKVELNCVSSITTDPIQFYNSTFPL